MSFTRGCGKEASLRPLYCYLMNKRADAIRRTVCVGPARKMYKSLARRLVDDGRIYMIPLFSGMQTPIFDAVEYLAEIGDCESIPRLKTLFGNYTVGPKDGDCGRTFNWQGFSVTTFYGPRDYLPPALQQFTANALLKLMSKNEAKEFVRQTLANAPVNCLSSETIVSLIRFAIEHDMSDLAGQLLKLGKNLKRIAEYEYDSWKNGRANSYSTSTLYAYEELIYGAYVLSADKSAKEEALQILVAEYNYQDACPQIFHNRPHHRIDFLLLEIVYRHLTKHPAEQERVIYQLNPERYEKDLEHYLSVQNRR